MESRQLSYQLLVSIIMVCCYQQIWAGRLLEDTNQTTKQPKLTSKLKTTSTAAAVTTKPELGTTILPPDFDLDGRSAFINNEFVADGEESKRYTSPHLRDLSKQRIQTILLNASGQIPNYNGNSTQIKEMVVESQKLPVKPTFGYDMGLFTDYEEVEYGFVKDCMSGNCEDGHEHLGEYDGLVVQNQLTQEHKNLNNSEPNIFAQSSQNKSYYPSSYVPQTRNQAAFYANKQNKPNRSNNYAFQNGQNAQNSYEATDPSKQQQKDNKSADSLKAAKISKPANQYNIQNIYDHIKRNEQPQQQLPSNQDIQSKPLQHYGHTNQNPVTNQNLYDKPKPQSNQKPAQIIRKSSQNLLNSQTPTQNNKLYTKQQIKLTVDKLGQIFNDKPLFNSNYTNPGSFSILSNDFYNNMESSSSPNGSFNTLTTSSFAPDSFNNRNPSLMPNFSYGNPHLEASSPFSTTFEQNNKFRTVSSSAQYVSTPFADIVFKYSIGMAKHSNSNVGNHFDDNQAQIFNVPSDNFGNGE